MADETAPSPTDDSPAPRDAAETDRQPAAPSFPIVGLGASAGGISALSAFFDALPPDNGLAIVIVQHLSPDHESELAEILQNHTFMRVRQISEAPEVLPGHVYVIPPGKTLTIREGRLRLADPERPRSERAPIDLFFRSLAEDLKERAVAVIFSGTGEDGAQGLARVKERGGLTLAQAPEDAEYPGMPQAAIRTGLVDLVAPATELAERIIGLKQEEGLVIVPRPEPLPKTDAEALMQILRLLRSRTGHDFTEYKRSTLLRRVQRRMQMTHTDRLVDYLGVLRENAGEPRELLKDLLISVTNFFRDPEAFVVLESIAIQRIMERKQKGDVVRAWVPGCATGQEAYTVAMLLCENSPEDVEVQVFATDIDEDAIAVARAGEYPSTIEADVSAERLRKYFEPSGGGYRVRESLRRCVLFAPHNLLSDPPFSALDLITCRNLLIYIQRDAQVAAFERFAYALRPNGFLFLGSSETANDKLFEPVDKRLRLYSLREIVNPSRPLLAAASRSPRTTRPVPYRPRPRDVETDPEPLGVEVLYEAWTLREHAPPRLLLDSRNEVTHVFGGAGRFLTEGEGRVTQDVLARIVQPLRAELRVTLHDATQNSSRAVSPFLRVEDEFVRLHVGPVQAPDMPEGLAEVVFETLSPEAAELLNAGPARPRDESAAVERLEAELKRAKERLQTAIEEHETGEEELLATNEELQSLNEELQSATEELETSKEELQSMNEELVTVNQELRTKVDELNRAYSDLVNLMSSTEIGTVFLDRELRVKRFTPSATELFHLLPADIGRPLDHVANRLRDLDIVSEAEAVLDSLVPTEREVQSDNGRWYTFRVVPYRTVEDQINGVVASFLDVTLRHRAEAEALRRADQQAAVADLGRLALEAGDIDDLLTAVCARVSDTLGTDCTKVLRHRPEKNDLLLMQGCGWTEGLVGHATVPPNPQSQAGFTLEQSEPVVVTDFESETRFSPPPLLTDHDIRSGMSVVIPGKDSPWGVLGTHAKRPFDFTERDAQFLQSVANVLAEALRRDADRARLHQLLTESERHSAEMEAVIEAIPDGIYIGDESGVRHANSVALRLIGVDSLEELQGHTRELAEKFNVRWPDTGTPLGSDDYPFFRALNGETVIEEIVATNQASGEDLYLRAAAAPIVVDGEPVGAVGVNTDVSSLIRLQKRLDERDALIRRQLAEITAVYDSAPLGISLKDREMRYLRINDYLAKVNGLPAEDHLGKTTAELFPDIAEHDDIYVERVLETGEPTPPVEYRVAAPGRPGEARDWLVQHYPVKDAEGEVIGVGTIVQEQTAIRRAEAALGESRARLQTLEIRLSETLTQLPTGVVLMEREGNGRLTPLYANPSSYELLNGTPLVTSDGEFADWRTTTAFTLDGRPVSFDGWPIGRALRGEVVVGEEYRLPREDGSWQHILVNAAPVHSDREGVDSAVVAFEDVTVRREAEDRIRALNETLEARVGKRTEQVRRLALALTLAEQRERSRIAQILHDNVQQVLHGVRLRVELLADSLPETGENEQQAEYIERMLAEAIEITRTLSVDLSPPVLEGGGLSEGLEWVARQMGELHDLTVRVQAEPLPDELPPENVTLVVQLVRELLFNVVKHSGVREASVLVSREDSTGVRVDVVDHGQGFDPEAIDEGFGLVSVRERVELLGGTFEVSSQEGSGTRSTLHLP